jgi:TonB family protein
MSPRAVRLFKEVRPMLWPWCAVSLLGAVRLLTGEFRLGPVHLDQLALLGAFVGIPLLATLPFGSEFQHHTLPVLLSQPEDRGKIWSDKTVVSIVSALAAAAVYYLSWHVALQDHGIARLPWLVWIAITACSAAYWVLLGQSTISGLMLNLLATAGLFGVALYGTTASLVRLNPFEPGTAASLAILGLVVAAAMAVLGRRRFLRFESIASASGADVVQAFGRLEGVFRPSAQCAWLNIVRREVRLLAPVWLLSLLAGVIVIAFGALKSPSQMTSLFAAAFTGIVLAVIPLLAATLSVGEEKTLGTQTWNLVLPMSIRRQWLLKLVCGIVACVAAQGWILIAAGNAGRFAFRPELALFLYPSSERLVLLLLSVVTFIAGFWCACAVKGTIRAALLTFPLIALVRLIVEAGVRLSNRDLIGGFNNFVLSTVHPYAFSGRVVSTQDHHFGEGFFIAELVTPLVLTAVMCAAAVAGSLRQFRRDSSGEEPSVLRRALPLLILALFTGVLHYSLRDLSYRPHLQQLMVLDEVHRAAGRLGIDAAALDESRPVTVTVSQLGASTPLSPLTVKWLRSATISISPTEPALLGMASRISSYYVRIGFSNGRECRTAGFYWTCMDPEPAVTPRRPPTMFVSADLAKAKVVSQVKPVLPVGVAGDRAAVVRLRIAIDENGSVTWVLPAGPPADEPFLSAAVEAVKQWRYQPFRRLGWPQVVLTFVTVTFP